MPGDPLKTFIGAGVLKFQLEGDSSFRDLGFTRSFVTTPKVVTKDYMQKRSGIRSIARHVTTEQGLGLTFVMDEIIKENLALYFMGTETPGTPATVHIMDLTEIRGALRFVGDNAFGELCQVDLPHVSLLPGGGPDWLTDDWLGLEMTGEAFRDETSGDFGTVLVGITGEVP